MPPELFRCLAIKHALSLYMRTGIKPNRMYTPKNMMRVASEITGKAFKPRDYQGAINALDARAKELASLHH